MDFGFTEEQRMIRETFEKFCKKELSKEYVAWMDENVDFPPDELWQKFVDIGLFRSAVPEEYGGEAIGGAVEAMIAFEPICKASMSVALALGTTMGFGVRFIADMGTEKMKEELLPQLAEGKLKMCMALTEPAGGTDILGAVSTFARDDGDSWVISGEKMFITGAHVSDYLITVCKTERDAKPSKSLSVFLVPAKADGITITRIPKISCHHCDSVGISFEDVVIPKENLLGTRGNGWYEMLNVLNPERIGVAMMGVGPTERSVRRTDQQVPDTAALSGGYVHQSRELQEPHIQIGVAVRSGHAVPPGGHDGEVSSRPGRLACGHIRRRNTGRIWHLHGVSHAAVSERRAANTVLAYLQRNEQEHAHAVSGVPEVMVVIGLTETRKLSATKRGR